MEVKFGAIPEHSKRVINRYVFTFPSKSGANCFSAALGAYLGSNHLVENWLNTEPFFEFLAVFWFIVEKLHYTNECSILIIRTFIR